MLPVSVCIITNLWHPKLESIIDKLGKNVAEILIGYDSSSCGTRPGYLDRPDVKLISLPWKGFSRTKNELAEQAANDWILSLDSDEVPDEELVQSLSNIDFSTGNYYTLYRFKRLSFFEGKLIRHGAWGNDKVTRLYNRKYTGWDNAIVHEALERYDDTVVKLLNGKLLHFTADNNDAFLKKQRKYAALSAKKYLQKGKKPNLAKLIFAPLFTFVKEYFFQSGFLDGAGGLKIAKGNAKYTFWKYKMLQDGKR